MNRMSTISRRILSLKRFFVFYQKPEYLCKVKKWLDIRQEDIPALEISDAEKLCKKPLVSVLIITYNQERFIRKAVDSALNQKTDFEYEILIGDDCSMDRTGEICAEYQKKHPDKIRFITADRNVSQLGGNTNRVKYRARGEFIAWLEGDDYWTDPKKLQKQVEVFHNHPEVTLCLCGQERLCLDGSIEPVNNAHFEKLLENSDEQDGTLFTGDDYFSHPLGGPIGVAMHRKADDDYGELCKFYYRTSFTRYFLLLKKGKGYFLKKPITMYRINPNGIWNGKTPMEQARFSYELYGQLLLHAHGNKAIESMEKYWWIRLKQHLFPWNLIAVLRRYFLSLIGGFLAGVLFALLLFLSMNIQPLNDARHKVDIVHKVMAENFISEDGLVYAYKGELPDAIDCERGFPNALGYWTVIENTPMFTGSYLSAMVVRAERLGTQESAEECKRMADGLMKIASASDVPGMIVRGFGKDGKSHYSSSTTCQYIPFFTGLHSYAMSRICPWTLKVRIRQKMQEVAENLLKYEWKCPCDGPLKGCFFGSINSKGLPHRDSAHYLFVLMAMYDITGDKVWFDRYNQAKSDFIESIGCTRLQACEKGWQLDKKVYDPEHDGYMWIYVCTQECLSELYRMDNDASARASYFSGLIENARHARPHMALSSKYDNNKGKEFNYANWRQGYSWTEQTNIAQALEVSRTEKTEILGNRKWYERKYVSQPLCAAAICAFAGMYQNEILETIRKYDYNQINISEFFFGEIAYWQFSR